jgi:FkbM family methyltransferase
MTPVRWARSKARSAVDQLFCTSSPDIKRVGDAHSGWVINVNPPPQTAYCAGVGQGMTLELELARMMQKPVLVFDPSPTGINTVSKSDARNLHFFPVGLAANAGWVKFSLPKVAGEGSYSVIQDGLDTVCFECYNLSTIMSRNGDLCIDLLKMDIEGFEYDIVNQFLDQKVPVRQLCVEFHAWLGPNQTLKTIARLYKAGYRIIHKHRGDYTFLLNQSRYTELKRNRNSRLES